MYKVAKKCEHVWQEAARTGWDLSILQTIERGHKRHWLDEFKDYTVTGTVTHTHTYTYADFAIQYTTQYLERQATI